MGWLDRFSRKRRAEDERRLQEFSDPYHHRASISDGTSLMVDIGKVRDRITLAIERLDLDISAEISLEHDVVSLDELAFFNQVHMIGVLVADVVNTAVRVMLARYPEDVVRRPIPPDYDVREFVPYTFSDDVHERACSIVDARGRAADDLDPSRDLVDALDGLEDQERLDLFIAVWAMCGNRIGAIKSYTGIE